MFFISDATADLVGYTHEELEKHFHEHVQPFADKRGIGYDRMFAELLSWYDSYQFSPERLVKVVNPVSVGRALSDRRLIGWWEATAGSTLIHDALKAAIKQCRDRNYAAAYLSNTSNLSNIYYVGVNDSPRKNQRTINDVTCEKASSDKESPYKPTSVRTEACIRSLSCRSVCERTSSGRLCS